MPTPQFQRGFTFVDGTSGNSSQLHQLVDSALILPGFISTQAIAIPVGTDSFVYLQGSTFTLKRCSASALLGLIPSNAAANIASLRKLGVGPAMAAAGDDVRFPARFEGIRNANGNGPDNAATAVDLTLPQVDISAVTAINWYSGNVFAALLTGDKTWSFTNLQQGRRILCVIRTQGHTVNWTYTNLGAKPVLTGGATNLYLVAFVHTNMGTAGWVEKAL